jgi:two-component system response regulator AtoC
MRSLQLLIIDDEPAIRQILSNAASNAGHSVSVASNGKEALERLGKGDIDVAVCDIRMPDITGIEVVEKAREQGIDTIFLMMTAYASVNTAIEAMRAGAYDYTIKPLRNEDFLNRIERLADVIHLKSENKVLRELVENQESETCDAISPAMRAVDRLVLKVAPTDSTVLITGPSGSGKGVVAKLIHQNSLRASRAFVPVNCGAIPENLLESEFFGHTKGAFTGASKAKRGLFVEADQGTIFLDEIGELPLNLQVKLLHVIEDQQVRALGSEQSRKIDQRREDLPLLIKHFIRKESAKMGLSDSIEIQPEAMQCLLAYDWPGNVRELQNVIARSLILAENDCIEVADLPQNIGILHFGAIAHESDGKGTLKHQLRNLEQAIIKSAIEEANGDRKIAAHRLGIGVSSLYRKLDANIES